MKVCVYWLALLLAFVPRAVASDPGLPDTIRVGCPTRIGDPGDTFSVPVYLWNDEAIHDFTLGFSVDSRFYTFVPPSLEGSILWGFPHPLCHEWFDIDSDSTEILTHWFSFTLQVFVPPCTGSEGQLLFTLCLRVRPGIKPTDFHIDSTSNPPGYDFELNHVVWGNPSVLYQISPQYISCWESLTDVADGPPFADPGETGTFAENFVLGQNFPNPFNSTTMITFTVPGPAPVSVEIYDVSGRKVRTLLGNASCQGLGQAAWDATDDRGKGVSSGVYLYRLKAGNFTETRKMLLLK